MKEPNASSIVICGEVLSSNLGDNVIAQTFSYLVRRVDPSVSVSYLDLSLRDSLGGGGLYEIPAPKYKRVRLSMSLKAVAWTFLERVLPGEVMTSFWWFLKWKPTRYRGYRDKLKEASILFIGGGQLLADNNFNFPLKIYGVSQCAKELDIPIFFFGCGVSRQWSNTAKFFFKQSMKNAASVTVRDVESFDRLKIRLPTIAGKLHISHDIALFCADAYGVVRQQNSEILGLGIASPGVLERHSKGMYKPNFDEDRLLEYWVKIIRELLKEKAVFRLFTNGAEEDQRFLEKIMNAIIELDSDCCLRAPRDSKELVEMIAGFRAVMAFRLHSNVVAYALSIPTIGLMWDDKVGRFFQESGRESYCYDIGSITPKNLVNNFLLAASEEPDIEVLERMKLTVFRQVKGIMETTRGVQESES